MTMVLVRVVILQMFLRNIDSEDLFGFKVNDLILPPALENGAPNEYSQSFKYDYYNGEELEIMSWMDDKILKSLSCDTSSQQIKEETQKSLKAQWGSTSLLLSMTLEEDQPVTLTCAVLLKDSRTLHVILKLSPIAFDYNPYIEGLSISHILKRYKNGNIYNISYEHNVAKPLKLSCYSLTGIPKWEFKVNDVEEKDIIPAKNKIFRRQNYSVISSRFLQKKNTVKSTQIQCKSTPHNKSKKDYITYVNINFLEDTTKNLSPIPLIIVLAVVLLAFVVVVAVAIRCCCKKRTTAANHETRNFTNTAVELPVDTEIYAVPYTPKTDNKMAVKKMTANKMAAAARPEQQPEPTYAALEFSNCNDRPTIVVQRGPLRKPEENYAVITPIQKLHSKVPKQ